MRNRLCFFIILFSLIPSWGGAWDDKDTHPTFTEEAVKNTTMFKGVLKSQLEFEGEIGEELYNGKESRTISEWLVEGSHLGDVPACRAANHFHNPWEVWKDSMLTDPPHNGGSSHHA